MDSVIRNVVEPYFEKILKRLQELDKKITNIDSRVAIIEHDFLVLRCKLNIHLTEPNTNSCKMEEID